MERRRRASGKADHKKQVVDTFTTLVGKGNYGTAERFIRQKLLSEPGESDWWHLLALSLQERGEHIAALENVDHAIELNSNQWLFHYNRSCILNSLDRPAEALQAILKSLQLQPNHPLSFDCAAVALIKLERYVDAIHFLHQAIRLKPDLVVAHFNLGNALVSLGELEQAKKSYSRALSLDPVHIGSLNNLGSLLAKLKEGSAAEECLLQAVKVDPLSGIAHGNLALFLAEEKKDYIQAALYFRRAQELQPEAARWTANLIRTLIFADRVADAIAESKVALTRYPDSVDVMSCAVFIRHYDPEDSPENVCALHVKLGREMARSVPAIQTSRTHRNRVPRVGYISPDFRLHPVGMFLNPVLETHSELFRPTLYSNLGEWREDEWTQSLAASSKAFRRIKDLDPARVAATVSDDEIDILVDLAGHTADNSLSVFLRTPAPIQVSWMGYFNTTGLAQMTYLLGDHVVTPPQIDHLFVERIWRLPDFYLCYRGPSYAGPVLPPPSVSGDVVTFGTFNAVPKINKKTVKVWAEILRRVPNARIVLRNQNFKHQESAVRCRRLFEECGVDPQKLLLLKPLPHAALLNSYSLLDIALDTFPYTGGTTTAEALWMGVPVVTIAGRGMVERISASLITAAGRPEWVARNLDEYIEIAVGLAQNRDRLAEIRGQQRERIIRSPLGDVERFTRNLEGAFQAMWQRYCDGLS